MMCRLRTGGAVGAICVLATVQAAAEEPSSVRRIATAGNLGQHDKANYASVYSALKYIFLTQVYILNSSIYSELK